MGNVEVSSLDVKKYFLLADAGKELLKEPRTPSQLHEMYDQIIESVFNLTDSEVNQKIKDPVRLERYSSLDWYSGVINLDDIGPYPKLKGLDARLTTGNVPQTAIEIERVRKGEIILDYENHPEEKEVKEAKFQRLVNHLPSFQRNLTFVYENFPIILLPSRTIRGDYNNWVKTEKLNLPLCDIFSHDIDDGSERAVNYALAGMKSIECFYSVPRSEAA